jgi:dienelactone hydrolase
MAHDHNYEEYSFQNEQGQKIVGMLHKPSGDGAWPLIIIAHGYGGSMDPYENLSIDLAENGFVVYRFDFYNTASRTDIPFDKVTVTNTLATLSFVMQKLKQHSDVKKDDVGILGHSIGGALAYLQAAQDPDIKALVLLAPVTEWGHTFAGLREEFREDANRYKLDDYAGKVKIPTLILLGTEDNSIKREDIDKLVKSLGGEKRLVLIDGASHHFDTLEHWQRVTHLTKEWFKGHLL